MGRSQMPPLSLWLKGSETEPNAKSVPTSILSPQFIHLSLRSRSGEIMCPCAWFDVHLPRIDFCAKAVAAASPAV